MTPPSPVVPADGFRFAELNRPSNEPQSIQPRIFMKNLFNLRCTARITRTSQRDPRDQNTVSCRRISGLHCQIFVSYPTISVAVIILWSLSS